MKRTTFLLSLIICLMSYSFVSAQTVFVLVRHAEKEQDGSKDPNLNNVGIDRAAKLMEILTQQSISGLYATPYKRTQQTLTPLATAKELSVNTYKPFDEEFLPSLFENHSNGYVVVSGHSNTIPVLVNQLIGEDRYEQLEETDYNDIFIVTAESLGTGTVVHLTY
ncbi:MAG: 2,3-bisphosphoglycerate-dependent phosphoglycerate mutase [Cyclobacteriaceae bacterium]|jgi:2,3-bisphosphoglycerate-dependent phosphoglycerate mutase